VGKQLSIAPAPGEGGGYFINVSENVKSSNSRKQVSVSLTAAEFFVIKRIGEFAIPYLLGFDLLLSNQLQFMEPVGYPGPGMDGYGAPPPQGGYPVPYTTGPPPGPY
jgi:hypothetical protein